MDLITGLEELRKIGQVIGDAAVIEEYEAEFTSDSDKAENNDDECEIVYGDFTESEDEQ